MTGRGSVEQILEGGGVEGCDDDWNESNQRFRTHRIYSPTILLVVGGTVVINDAEYAVVTTKPTKRIR